MKQAFNRWLQSVWYERNGSGVFLLPLAWLYRAVIAIRRCWYRAVKLERFDVPIIIIGNITVGGTGKTPLLIWLVQFLRQQGFTPGIISRGYGGQAQTWPQWVDADSNALEVGDEAVVIARQTACPMAVGPVRTDDVKLLLQHSRCDVIVADDGLQHYALARDIEIVVIDGQRRSGNGRCLPAGPLREPEARLQEVDLTIVNGSAMAGELAMNVIGDHAVNLKTGEQKPLTDFVGQHCHALAGIGNPQRFYQLLENKGLTINSQSFPDHHVYRSGDLTFADDAPVLMTEKDAVKCAALASDNTWFVPIGAQPDVEFGEKLMALLKEKKDG